MIPATKINVPIARTSLTEAEIQSVIEPLRSGWLVQGPRVREFQEKWCAFSGVKHSIAATSCTSALHSSLAVLGLQPGDEVIVPAFTWIATANVVEHLGGNVVLCNIGRPARLLSPPIPPTHATSSSLRYSSNVGLIEIYGSGIHSILDDCREASVPAPVLEMHF